MTPSCHDDVEYLKLESCMVVLFAVYLSLNDVINASVIVSAANLFVSCKIRDGRRHPQCRIEQRANGVDKKAAFELTVILSR